MSYNFQYTTKLRHNVVYPNCAVIIAGDFNRLNVSTIKKHFRLKQIVKKPTRKNAILDLILTNIHDYYEIPCTFPPFGLSDHNTVTVEGKEREHSNAIKFVYTRDKRASRKAEMGRYLNEKYIGLYFFILRIM